MDDALQELIDSYLAGALSREQTRAFEHALAEKPEVSQALCASLAMRDLLQQMPPKRPPQGLEERIADALALEPEARPDEEKRRLPSLSAAVSGASWSLRAPALAFSGTFDGQRQTATGLSQVRWALGPLGASRSAPKPEAPKKPLWRRALALAWK